MSNFVVKSSNITDRLDVKFCLKDSGRLKQYWISIGHDVKPINSVLSCANNREIVVDKDEKYTLLKVTYNGEVLEADIKDGDEISYSKLYMVHAWDILLSNMGVGRGAISVIPKYYEGQYVSNEYTILTAKSKEEAIFYTNILRTKEILGDILTSTTGMNRGRIKWKDMSKIEVPLYDETKHKVKEVVQTLDELWDAYSQYNEKKSQRFKKMVSELKLEDEDATKRWLAYKPPE